MLTDDQIAAMTPAERRDLITRLARPVDDIASTRWLRRTREIRIALIVLSAVVLVPWTVYLAVTLPRAYVAHNWDRTWVGFDVLLLAMVAATGVLLLCDAWFDVMTAHGEDRAWSVATALVVELPLSAVLIAGSLQVLRLVAARLWAVEGGAHVWQVRIPLPSEADLAVRRRPTAPRSRPR